MKRFLFIITFIIFATIFIILSIVAWVITPIVLIITKGDYFVLGEFSDWFYKFINDHIEPIFK